MLRLRVEAVVQDHCFGCIFANQYHFLLMYIQQQVIEERSILQLHAQMLIE
jgi:hypothetical protein